MRHDINKKNYFNISNKNRIMKKIVDFCCSVELKKQSSFILCRQQVVYKHNENLT